MASELTLPCEQYPAVVQGYMLPAEAVERISLRTRRLDAVLAELGGDPRSGRVFLECDT